MSKVISSMTFLSNRAKYGPYGPEEGAPFSFQTTNGEIIGFHGTSGDFLNSVGVHVKPSAVNSGDSSMLAVSSSNKPLFNINKELVLLPFSELALDPGPWGGVNGKPFDDGFNERVKQILLSRKDKFVSSIQIEYEFHGEVISSAIRGSLGREELVHRIQFRSPEEYLMQITGYLYYVDGDENNVAITSLTFFSNKQKYGPVGEEIGTFFSSPVASVPPPPESAYYHRLLELSAAAGQSRLRLR
ncbi:hypothetical protein KSP39_PZI006437 [Platanthera zijinensis]|uniref:Jacalin-type lectin domain-containing protein n=1 Tax=Platanthera zijinensis TaxID=2320716 RepID=A0AAP0BNX8_9ASPA